MSTTYPARLLLPTPQTDPAETLLSELVAPTPARSEDEDEAQIRDENDDRAERALAGVRTYAALSFHREEALTTVLGDLLGDLRHACDALGLDWETVNDSGAGHYGAEIRGEL